MTTTPVIMLGMPAAIKLGSLPVILAGSPELKSTYLTMLAAGQCGFSYCLSEPEAGALAGDDWNVSMEAWWDADPGEIMLTD